MMKLQTMRRFVSGSNRYPRQALARLDMLECQMKTLLGRDSLSRQRYCPAQELLLWS